jgi:hypothetical protein
VAVEPEHCPLRVLVLDERQIVVPLELEPGVDHLPAQPLGRLRQRR